MFRTRKLKQHNGEFAEYCDPMEQHRRTIEFHPHCIVPQLALAEARRFDDAFALAHTPVYGDGE